MGYLTKTVLGALATAAALAALAAPIQANITASSYPTTVTGTTSADELKLFGSTLKCAENSFSGTLSASSPEMSLTPTYKNCKFGTLPATFHTTVNNTLWTFSVGMWFHISGPSWKVTVYASTAAHTENKSICVITVPSQGPLSGFSTTNESGKVKISGTITNIKATQERKSAVCPTGTETTTGEFVIQAGGMTLSGSEGKSIDVG